MSTHNCQVDKFILYNMDYPNFAGVPKMFKDPTRYRDVMRCVCMGMDNSYFEEYAKGDLDERRVCEIAHMVAKDTLHKMQNIEYTYNIRDSANKKEKSHPRMNVLRTRYTTLLKAMTDELGSKAKAEKTMSDKLGGPDKK